MILFLFLFVILAACAEEEKGNEDVTIKPIELTDREKKLVSATGISYTKYFEMNGSLGEGEDLVTTFTYYKDGEFLKGGSKMFGALKTTYEDDLLSFAMLKDEELAHLYMGDGNGLGGSKATIPEDLGMSTYGGLSEKHTLVKGEEAYVAYWVASGDNSISSGGMGDPTKLPEVIKEEDFAIVMSVEIKDKEDINH